MPTSLKHGKASFEMQHFFTFIEKISIQILKNIG